jgi:4-aminobutyrate aminotransferase
VLQIKEATRKEADKLSWIGPAPWIETPPPGIAARAIMERDDRVASPSYTRNYPLVIRRAAGSVVEDVDGNRYLDFAAGLAVCAAGHCHAKVVAAIRDQVDILIHAGGHDYCYEPMVTLAEKLAAIAPGRSDKRVMLLTSGAEATEAAFKLARRHTGRKWVVAFHGASHGRTMGALSLSCSTVQEKAGFEPLVPMVAHAPYGDIEGLEEHIFRQQVAPEEVAAIFVEPLLAGGYVIPPKNFLPRLRSLCDRHGTLLVCDETETGMGRTGKMFACQHFGVVPDVVLCAGALGGGLPLGAVIAPTEIMSWPPGAHHSTFGGNPISCAAALATIGLLDSVLTANAAKLGQHLLMKLSQIAGHRKCVDNPRGLGLMCAADIVNRKSGKGDPRQRDRIMQEAFRRGLILLGCGPAGIRFCPPLVINETQIEVGLTVFDEVVATVGS